MKTDTIRQELATLTHLQSVILSMTLRLGEAPQALPLADYLEKRIQKLQKKLDSRVIAEGVFKGPENPAEIFKGPGVK